MNSDPPHIFTVMACVTFQENERALSNNNSDLNRICLLATEPGTFSYAPFTTPEERSYILSLYR